MIVGGVCDGMDPELFFPTSGNDRQIEAAKAVCATCPVLGLCREHGIRHEKWGVWGGMTEGERRKERKRRKAAFGQVIPAHPLHRIGRKAS